MVLLGTNLLEKPYSPVGSDIHLTDESRRQGVYVIGTTGTGKTTLLKSIAAQDMRDPKRPALIVLDPHGDMIDDLLGLVPRERRNDVILFSPGDRLDQYDYPVGLNILECNRDDPHERDLVSSTVISTLYKMFFYSWGPRMEDLLRNSVLTLLERPKGGTFLDLWVLLVDEMGRDKDSLIPPPEPQDPFLWNFWHRQFGSYTPHDKGEIAGSSLNKIGRFLGNPLIRNIIAQPETKFKMREVMDKSGILFCNLSKGDLGEDNSSLLGTVLINLVLIAALSRRNMSYEERLQKPVHLIVDEYQTFATESFPILQSEARKYGITVTVAHQYRDQLDDLNKGSTMNCGNFICLRVSGRDSLELASQFDNTPPEPDDFYRPVMRATGQKDDLLGEIFEEYKPPTSTSKRRFVKDKQPRRTYSDMAGERANQLSILPNYQALCRLMEKNKLGEYVVSLKDDDSHPTDDEKKRRDDLTTYIRKRSKEHYGKDRRFVENEIDKRLRDMPRGKPAPDAS